MTDLEQGGAAVEPVIGAAPALRRRSTLVRLGVLVAVAVLALSVRSAGLLSPDPSGFQLPPLPAATQVSPGLLRGGQPAELDLVLLRDDFGVRGVVDVDGASAEEQAVTAGLGMHLLEVTVGEQGPSPNNCWSWRGLSGARPRPRPMVAGPAPSTCTTRPAPDRCWALPRRCCCSTTSRSATSSTGFNPTGRTQ